MKKKTILWTFGSIILIGIFLIVYSDFSNSSNWIIFRQIGLRLISSSSFIGIILYLWSGRKR